jgi:RNA polymerase sigma factor (sigma-70 family)
MQFGAPPPPDASGDLDARETLAQRYRQPAYLLTLQMLSNRDDAMDVAQDAMLRFFTTLGSFDSERRVQPWLFTIVRNQVRDLWRRRQPDEPVGVPRAQFGGRSAASTASRGGLASLGQTTSRQTRDHRVARLSRS